jgi:uncharacterized membrane protein
MDFYLLFKFLHVASAIIWIGAGIGLVVLGIAADRKTDRAEFIRVIRSISFLAPRVFVPTSLATLVFGLIVVFMRWSFTELWVWIGLVGFAATFLTGNFLLKPRADRVAEITAREGASDNAMDAGRELLQLSKFDYVMLLVVVADMVFKPVAGDWPVLLLMAVVIVGAGLAFLGPVLRSRPAMA